MVNRWADASLKGEEKHESRRTILWSGAVAAAAFILESGNVALADVKIVLSNVQATPVPCPGQD